MAGAGTDQSGLYEALIPPFQQITDTNRGPIALVVATTFMIITTLTVTVKVYTMYATTRKLSIGDGMMLLALVRQSPDNGPTSQANGVLSV